MNVFRKETLVRIDVTQSQLDGMRQKHARLNELCRDLEDVVQALAANKMSGAEINNEAEFELIRLERELENDVRHCLATDLE